LQREEPVLDHLALTSLAMSSSTTILIVDDEQEVRDMTSEYLMQQGFKTLLAANGAEARALLNDHPIHLALLDLRMPGEDGFSLARHLREHHGIAIVMVTAADTVMDRVVGLEIGADDYLCKPFHPRELLARVRSVLRRSAPSLPAPKKPESRVKFGKCVLDLESHCLFAEDGGQVPITSMEFDLLQAFARNPNRALSRDHILSLTQQREHEPFDRSIDIRIGRLRRKIERNPDTPQTIKTLRGAGYMFVPQD
jgi:two-component system phosphate regulon response regulator OmpR